MHAMEDLQEFRQTNFATCCLAALQTGLIKPTTPQHVPHWPSSIAYKCRTIKSLADGPYKGQEAKIISSLWSMHGIDTVENTHYVFGTKLPCLWRFFFETDTVDAASWSPLYYGKIMNKEKYILDDDENIIYHTKPDIGGGCIISESWLSNEDRKNLVNFHRWELGVLFNTKTLENQSALQQKIKNELQRSYLRHENPFLMAVALMEFKRDSTTQSDNNIFYHKIIGFIFNETFGQLDHKNALMCFVNVRKACKLFNKSMEDSVLLTYFKNCQNGNIKKLLDKYIDKGNIHMVKILLEAQ